MLLHYKAIEDVTILFSLITLKTQNFEIHVLSKLGSEVFLHSGRNLITSNLIQVTITLPHADTDYTWGRSGDK